MNLFCKITISPEEKRRRLIIYAVSSVLLITVFFYGFITVYINSYNIIHDNPMEVLSFYKTNDEIYVVILNHKFEINI